jgi:type II secretory pathway component PulC
MTSTLALPYIIPLPDAIERTTVENAYENPNINSEFLSSQKYAAALAKPLFHVNRLPPKPKPVVAPKPVQQVRIEAPFTVVGIIASGDGFNAYLVNKNTGNTQVAKKGGILSEWHVEEVTETYVIVSLEGEKRTLRLE